jgi:transposase InsO family protein
LSDEIRRVYKEHFEVYGIVKVWKQLLREGIQVGHCTVGRLMKKLGLQGVRRGKKIRTTVSDPAAPCPKDHVNRQFQADRPNLLWVSDYTYVSTWQGFVSRVRQIIA